MLFGLVQTFTKMYLLIIVQIILEKNKTIFDDQYLLFPKYKRLPSYLRQLVNVSSVVAAAQPDPLSSNFSNFFITPASVNRLKIRKGTTVYKDTIFLPDI